MAIVCLLRLHFESAAENALEALLVNLLVRVHQRMKDADDSPSGILIPGSRHGAPEWIYAAALSKSRDSNTGRMVSIDTQEALSKAAGYLIVQTSLIARSPERNSDETLAGGALAPEFCTGVTFIPGARVVSVPVNRLSILIGNDAIKEGLTRLMRQHGQRFDIVELDERRRKITEPQKPRYIFRLSQV